MMHWPVLISVAQSTCTSDIARFQVEYNSRLLFFKRFEHLQPM